MLGLLLIGIPLLFAGLSPRFKGTASMWFGKIAALTLVLLFGLSLTVFLQAGEGSEWREWSANWVPFLDVGISFHIDGLGALMTLLIVGIGAAVFAYASVYLKDDPLQSRFTAVLMTFMAGMLGVVISENLIQLFIFWELTSITSYLLIGHKSESKEARWHALQALLVTGGGGVVMMLGFVLMGHIAGSYEMRTIIDQRELILAHPALPVIIVTLLLGAFSKSGQFPFHFWLPNAMSAPTPVSAFLHSATMVKAGVFLIAKMNPIFGGFPGWSIPVIIIGCITMVYSATMGMLQIDLKKILAYTTLSVLGLLTMMLGVGTDLALKSAIVFLFGHALYKSTLFLCAGNIEHGAHTRDVRMLGSLGGLMPLTAATTVMAALSNSGFPPFIGFLGKEYVYKAGLEWGIWAPVLVSAAVFTNLLLLALAFKVGFHPFFHRIKKPFKSAHDPSLWMSVGPLLLAVTGLVTGIFPGLTSQFVVTPAVSAVMDRPVEFEMKLWHGINLPLILSVVTVAGGLLIYRARHWLWGVRRGRILKDVFESAFERSYQGFLDLATWQTRVIQSGSLRQYFYWILASLCFLSFFKILIVGTYPPLEVHTPIKVVDLLAMTMILVGALYALITQSRVVMLLALGVVGYGVALIFAIFSAPDLAITQILVETLIVVLFVFCINRLSKLRSFSTPGSRFRDGIVATGSGVIVVYLMLQSQWLQFAPPISDRYTEWSYTIAKGKNVVNVILVDFRALDTLGEIVVLAIAALGVFILMDPLIRRSKNTESEENTDS